MARIPEFAITTLRDTKNLPLLCGTAAVLVLALLGALGFFDSWENTGLDLLQKRNPGNLVPDDRIILVAITTEGMNEFNAYQVFWPWPRDVWSNLIANAAQRGALAVVFDMYFGSPGLDHCNSSGTDTDGIFAASLSGEMPVIIAAQLVPQSDSEVECPKGLLWNDARLRAHDLRGYKLLTPHPRFSEARMGLSNAPADRDGVIRRIPLLWDSDYGTLPGLALQAAALIDEYRIEDTHFTPDADVLLRYYGPGGPHNGPFPYIRAFDLITGTSEMDLRGKILIVGAYAAGLLDHKPTPVASGTQPFPGFELHATLLSNVLQGHELHKPPRSLLFVITLLPGLICVGLLHSDRLGGALQAGGFLVVLIVYYVICVMAFSRGVILPMIGSFAAAVAGAGTHIFLDWRFEGRQKQELRNLFSRYLQPSVIDEMIKDPEAARLDGVERRVTIMFADIVGFTTASETMAPHDVVALLNLYFKEFVDVVLKRSGFLDKFIGDAVMTLFGLPAHTEQSQIQAAKALLEVQTALRLRNEERLARGAPALRMTIGMHTDKAIIGNIGHPRRMDYTAIGSGVNIASRIEGANRVTKTQNLVSEGFCADLHGSFPRREIGRLLLKGLTIPLRVYELLEDRDHGPWVDHWAEAWDLWRANRRSEAVDIWQTIAKQRTEDPAITVFLELRRLKMNQKGANDDVLVLANK